MNPYVELIRGLTRPLCTFFGLVSIPCMLHDGIDVPSWYVGFVGMMLTFWFSDRLVQHIREKPK